MKRMFVALAIAALGFGSPFLFALGRPEIPLDEQIKQKVVDQLTWDDRVDASQVEVGVEFGRVALSGTVSSNFTEQAAIDDAWSVDGVVAVVNDLESEPYGVASAENPLASAENPLASTVKGALLVDSQIDGSAITVSATHGQVTLSGTVKALWQKVRAEEVASGVSGVLGVTNEIAVVPTRDVVDEVIARDIEQAIARNSNADVDNVDVTVENGNVTLAGTVADWVARDAVYQAAINTMGVKDVTDRLIVESGVGPLPTDDQIGRSIRDQLRWDNQVDATDVTVEVVGGQVILIGTVPSYSAKLAAKSDALMIRGVVSVENDLIVEPAEPITNDAFLATRAENVLDWNPDVHVADLAIKVIAGVATLEGRVDALWQKNRAEELVMNIQGVIGVINKITVVPTESILDQTIAEDIVDAIDRNINVNVDDVTVSVDRGTVTLSGNVPDITAKNAAFDAALNTTGVRAVINDIKVSS
jgi:osmotically-inducible protein OsmY